MLKPLDMDPGLVAWQFRVLTALDGDPDFRVAPPLAAWDGSFVVAGWTAWRFEPGRAADGRWPEIIEVGRSFHARLVGVAADPALRERSDVWAVADRLTWADPTSHMLADLSARVGSELDWPAGLDHVVSALQPIEKDAQLIHGDLTGNVLVDDHLPPLVIDFSPYWHPPGFASAVVVAVALVFHNAPDTVVELLDADPGGPQYLLRALLFRAMTACLARPGNDDRDRLDGADRDPVEGEDVRYRRAINVALQYAQRSPG